MAPGTMIEGSKVEIEGEKCGLDMSSYEDLNRTSVGGDCNGKDDYVFVNGSDDGSDDHEINGDGHQVQSRDVVLGNDPDVKDENGKEVNLSGASVGDSEEKLEEEKNVSDHKEVDNGERENEGEVEENGELGKENGQIVPEKEIVDEVLHSDVGENGTNAVVVDGVENGEPSVEKEGNFDSGVDDKTTPVLNDDDDDKVRVLEGADEGSGAEISEKDELHTVETLRDEDQVVEDEVAVAEIEPLDKDVKGQNSSESGDLEGQTREDGVPETQFLGGEVEPDSVDAGSPELLVVSDAIDENHSSENQQVEPQSVDEVNEVGPKEGEAEVKEQVDLDGGSAEMLLGDAIDENQSSDNQQPESQSVDEVGLKETEAEVQELVDLDASVADVKQDLESVDSDVNVVTSDLNQSEVGEVKVEDSTDLTAKSDEVQEVQTDPLQSEGAESQSCELVPKEVENEVVERGDVDSSEIAVNQESTSLDSEGVAYDLKPSEEDEIKVESAPELTVEETEVKDPQSESLESEEVGNQGGLESATLSVEEPVSDVANEANEGVEANEGDLKEKSDSVDEVVEIQESPVVEDVVPDQVTEETGSVNVTDKEISLEDHDSEKDEVAEESTNPSETQAANDTAVDGEDGSDLGKECLSEKVSDNVVNDTQTAPVSGETSNDAEDGVKSEEGENAVSDVEPIKEEVVDNAESAADTLPQPKAEIGNDSIPDHAHDASLENTAANGENDVIINKSNSSSSDSLKSRISFGSFVCEAPFPGNDVSVRGPEVSDRSVELSSGPSNGTCESPESKIKPSNGVAVQNGEANGVHINSDEASSLPIDGSVAIAVKGQQNNDVMRRPFYYLIRVPRCEDEKLREQIRLSELQVEEKTRSRDAVRMEYQKRKGAIVQVKADLEAAKAEERAARDLVRAKRREIDESQSLVNLAKNAITVEDVQAKILNMEHRIQHETLPLKEEKQLVRDIKQMKNFKDQLYGDAQKQEQIKQALDQKDQVEEQLKVLRKELAALREDLSKAEENVRVVKKRYDEESALLNESFIKFKSADTVRQDAYVHLLDLRKQWSEKNKHFRGYKDDARAANDFAVAGEMSNLERHCVDQVEKFMDLWNNNDEFRMEYTKYNARSTLRRLRTLDGRSLGPDEEPPSFGNASNDNRVTVPAKVNSVPTVTSVERDFPAMPKNADANPLKKVVEQKNKTVVPTKKMAEAATIPKNSSAEEASGRVEIEEEEKEEQHKPTKEEEELARKAEQKRREEEEARLREQRKLEEKAKAMEALERKKRMAEKALARAQFRAQKEAEQKEKEREKRAKKKDKKRGITSEPVESEPAVPLESPSEITTPREPEVTEKPATVATKKPQKPSPYAKQLKTTKTIPPPLRNRGRRRMQQWMWALATVVAIVALFFLGNSNFLRDNSFLGSEPAY